MKKLQIFFFSCLAIILALLYSVVAASISDNPLPLHYKAKATVNKLIPQGWSFFTRNPLEDDTYLYGYDDGKLTPLSHRMNEFKNGFGLKRISKYSGMEVGKIIAKIKSTEWHEFDGGNLAAFVDSLPTVELRNSFPSGSLNGNYVIKLTPPIPFQWARNMKGEMQSKIAKVKVVPIIIDAVEKPE